MNNIIFIGMPGVGKSTIGVVLAKRLGMQFIDSDLKIQEVEKKLLHEIISEKGLDGFLEVENQVNAALEVENCIIATGGSAVFGKEAMDHFAEIGVIIYLSLPYDEIEERLGDLTQRGVALKEGQTLRQLFDYRQPFYEKYAQITVDCHAKQIREIVSEIANLVTKER